VAGDAIPGWAPVDERILSGDPAFRPIGNVLREAVTAYRRHARVLLVASAVVELPLALLTAPYVVNSFKAFADLGTSILHAPGWWSGFVPPPSYAVFANPTFTAAGGVLLVAPLLSFVLLSAFVTSLLLRPAASPDPGAVRFVAREWRSLAAIELSILGLGLLVGLAWGRALAGWWTGGLTPPDISSLGWLVLVNLLTMAAFIIGAYAFIRGALTVSALVLEGDGLRRAVWLSVTLTQRRAMRIALALAVGVAIGGAANAFASVLAGSVFWLTLGPDLTTALLVSAALYAFARILVAPIAPLLIAVLYRDFREAGDHRRA
jgi:hypothetical protein